MTESGTVLTPHPPGQAWLRLAAALSQLGCGVCLLIGAIGLVLIGETHAASVARGVVWLVAALAGLVFGGLIPRGGALRMIAAAAIDAGFGGVLVIFDRVRLRALLQILPASDVDLIARGLSIAGLVMIGTGVLCVAALPLGVRYARWFRAAAARNTRRTTVRWSPPGQPARTMTYVIPDQDRPGARRRLYIALGGVAVGVGAGIGVLVSSANDLRGRRVRAPVVIAAPPAPAAEPRSSGDALAPAPVPTNDPALAAAQPGSPSPGSPSIEAQPAVLPDTGPLVDRPSEPAADRPSEAAADRPTELSTARSSDRPTELSTARSSDRPTEPVQSLVLAEHGAIARADRAAWARLLASGVFGFGVDAAEVAEGRDAVLAQLTRDLGEPPAGGFTVISRALSLGEDHGHAWIAEELELAAPGSEPRTLALSALAAVIDGRWQIVALHWAVPVDDATARRLAILGRWPRPAPVPDRGDGPADFDQAVRAAFASRSAFTDALSERADSFNLGSGGERAHGATIRRIFAKLRAQVRIRGGVRTSAGAWDSSQRAAPRIGWAALEVDYTDKTPAATEVTQTFRVLAILVRDKDSWKIVQTHWSNGGPLPPP